jgi:hypothetical protein
MSLNAYDDEFREISSLGRLSDVRSRIGRARDGVAFSKDSVSMSFADAHELAKVIQAGFDVGKTVLKTVITFDDRYLDGMRVSEPGTSTGLRGAHKGHLDQLRLRHAIQVGMDRMSRGFDDLVWIASMHLDKAHAHVHVAGVDLGMGRMRYDGQQRGKLTKRDMMRLRSGINDDLTASYDLSPFYGTATLERMREANTVRSYVHAAVEHRGVPQLILAALPEDTSLWRATSKDPRMHRAIGLAVDYVRNVLQEPSSGFGEAMTEVYAYTERFAKDRSQEERASLVMRASRRIESGCVQAVFDTLRSMPEEQRTVESSLVDMMAAEGLTLASASAEDSMADFAYKLRAFSTRLRHHTDERRRFHDEEERYLSVRSPAPESRAAYDFFAFERLYQEKLMAKYQHLMGFLPYDGKWSEELLDLLSRRADWRGLSMLLRILACGICLLLRLRPMVMSAMG